MLLIFFPSFFREKYLTSLKILCDFVASAEYTLFFCQFSLRSQYQEEKESSNFSYELTLNIKFLMNTILGKPTNVHSPLPKYIKMLSKM